MKKIIKLGLGLILNLIQYIILIVSYIVGISMISAIIYTLYNVDKLI